MIAMQTKDLRKTIKSHFEIDTNEGCESNTFIDKHEILERSWAADVQASRFTQRRRASTPLSLFKF